MDPKATSDRAKFDTTSSEMQGFSSRNLENASSRSASVPQAPLSEYQVSEDEQPESAQSSQPQPQPQSELSVSLNPRTTLCSTACVANRLQADWANEDDCILAQLVIKLGRNWKAIAGHLNGKRASQIKQRFYSVVQPNIPRYADASQLADHLALLSRRAAENDRRSN